MNQSRSTHHRSTDRESNTHVAGLKLTVKTERPPNVGERVHAVAKLTTSEGEPVAVGDMQETHTERIHLLIVDESLTDFHHEHPAESSTRGEFSFSFLPKNGGTYAIWADVTPASSGEQEYVRAELTVRGAAKSIDETLATTATVNGYVFRAHLENGASLRAGEEAMITVVVTGADQKPARNLEPVMGAFAHGVGFPANRVSVVHAHPMGGKPDSADQRSGPELKFHVEPNMEGFLKFYVQTRIAGHDFFAPFGFKVGAKRGQDAQQASPHARHA
jgi:hypothetical protein